MSKLYYWPGTCAITIHVILEEIGKPYTDEPIDLSVKQQYTPEYLAVNPKGKVPALVRDDGSVLTEVPAIAFWLALTNPQAGLLADDIESRVRTLEAMDYIAATVHMQGAARVWRPALFVAEAAQHGAVQARGEEIVRHGFDVLRDILGGKDWLIGDHSIVDASLFFIEYWASEKMHWKLPDGIAQHYRRMRARPAVARALAREGLG